MKKSLAEYLEGELPPGRSEEIARHLDACPKCSELAEKLRFSGAALSSLEPVRLSDEAAARTLAAMRSEQSALSAPPAWKKLLLSPRAIAVAGVSVAVLLGAVVVVGVAYRDGDTGAPPVSVSEEKAEGLMAPEAGVVETSARDDSPLPAGFVVPAVMPEVKVSTNDYNGDSVRSLVEDLEVREQYAAQYTMGDAILLGPSFVSSAAEELQEKGGDGAMFEAMVSYLTTSETVLLPCYVEKALFEGRGVYLIGLAAPPRTGESKNLSRVEVWVLDPDSFQADPETSIVFFLEHKLEQVP